MKLTRLINPQEHHDPVVRERAEELRKVNKLQDPEDPGNTLTSVDGDTIVLCFRFKYVGVEFNVIAHKVYLDTLDYLHRMKGKEVEEDLSGQPKEIPAN